LRFVDVLRIFPAFTLAQGEFTQNVILLLESIPILDHFQEIGICGLAGDSVAAFLLPYLQRG